MSHFLQHGNFKNVLMFNIQSFVANVWRRLPPISTYLLRNRFHSLVEELDMTCREPWPRPHCEPDFITQHQWLISWVHECCINGSGSLLQHFKFHTVFLDQKSLRLFFSSHLNTRTQTGSALAWVKSLQPFYSSFEIWLPAKKHVHIPLMLASLHSLPDDP